MGSQPPDEATRRGRGRPKKPPVDVSNVLGQITPTVNLKRVSSTSLRSSASSSSNPTSDSTTTSSQNSDESSENSGVNSRPKRSRKLWIKICDTDTSNPMGFLFTVILQIVTD